jgi:uncharacterized protein YPO0396
MDLKNVNLEKLTQERLDRMESHQKELKKDLDKVSSDVKEIKDAIIGNVLSEDKGMVGKLKEMEKELEDLKKYRIKNGVYMKIIVGIGAIIGTVFITMVVKGLIQVTL